MRQSYIFIGMCVVTDLASEIAKIDDCLSAMRPTVTDGQFSFREANCVPDRY